MVKKAPLPGSSYSAVWPGDTRTRPPLVADERTLLVAYLEYYRATVELKCSGVPRDRVNDRVMPPSTMTLHGLIRHLAGVEQWWIHYQFADEDVRFLYDLVDEPAADFEDLSGDFDEVLDTWRAMCARSREIVARASSLDDTGIVERTGEAVSLRRILLHMIVEYARHSGHVDFLREAIDGEVGQ